MTFPLGPAVIEDIALHCADELGRPMAFLATFHYDDQDPYAVGITFHVPAGEVPWVVARSLLRRGLTEPAGDGDIRLWPSLDDDGCAIVQMMFHSPEGRLRVAVRRTALVPDPHLGPGAGRRRAEAVRPRRSGRGVALVTSRRAS